MKNNYSQFKGTRITPMMGKKTMIFHCEESIYNRIKKLSEYRFVKPETLIDVIVKDFTPKFEDVIYFAKGGYSSSFADKMISLLRSKDKKVFIPLQVDDKTYEKLGNAKRYYGMNKSAVLKHIFITYERTYEF